MNYTASGAIAVGAPNSLARFASEAGRAADNQHQLLLLTDEGKQLLRRFANSVGCDFDKIESSGEAGNWIEAEGRALFSFLAAICFCLSKA